MENTQQQELEQKQQQELQQEQKQEPTDKKVEAFKSFATQKDYDDEAARIKGSAEHKAKQDILKKLGLGLDDMDKLEKMKSAYENSLSEEEKTAEALKELDVLKAEIVEKDAIIVALTKLSGKETADVTKLVKMAKGLVGDDCTIDQALDEVMALSVAKQQKQDKPPVVSNPLNNPVGGGDKEENPFETGNMTKMGELMRSDIEKAKQMAKIANYPIRF